MDLLALLLGLLLGVILGALLSAVFLQRRRSNAQAGENPAVLEARHQVLLTETRAREAGVQSLLREELASMQATADGLRDQIADQKRQYREIVDRQRDDQAARTIRDRQESQVLQALAPVKDSLQHMQAKVAELD